MPSLLKPTPAEQKAAALIATGSAAEKAVQRLVDALKAADQETMNLVGKERLDVLSKLSGGNVSALWPVPSASVLDPLPSENPERVP